MTEKKDKLQESLESLFASYPLENDKVEATLNAGEKEGKQGTSESIEDPIELSSFSAPDPQSKYPPAEDGSVAAPLYEGDSPNAPGSAGESWQKAQAQELPPEGDGAQSAQEEAESSGERSGSDAQEIESGERVVVFSLGSETFGMDIHSIRTLVKPQETFPVPHMPDYLVGLTNLRGEIVPVIDLRTRLGIYQSNDTETTRFVVAEKEEGPICLVVDNVIGIEYFASDTLENPSEVIAGVNTTYLRAIGKSEERLVLLLDLDRVLGEKILYLRR